ncbi:hypothetical protein T440DRAFT_473662 [Plenodomus tracheiphilus IPT5]|uniref:Uncharacterized protein n=1 Tax=Plenodomus tracheiphilus IPT5 TaxID=1408161 RepID=A0A6A7AMA4_9PLEO|nr:hypothetical protein T440DRAFT_473662 [Plenodomus tracheiphilus IPT5]
MFDHEQNITAEEAAKLRGSDPNITWKDVDKDWRKQILENVNTQLGEEKIPPVSPDVLKWRMRKALGNRKYEAKKSAGESAPSSAAT